MRRSIMLLAKCYPRAWRERYGVEFDALMEDVEPDFREFANVLGGAVKLQLQGGTGLVKLAGAMAILAMLVSVGAWKIVPQRYVSTAQVRVTIPAGGDAAKAQADQDMESMVQEILSRSSIAEMIQRPSLDLYRGERMRIPMEDVIELMRRDIMVRREDSAFSVAFAYADRFKAQAVTHELTTKFLEQSVLVARRRESMWQSAWKEHAPPGVKLELAALATGPQDPTSRLASFLARGLGIGLILGLLVFAVMRRPRVMRQWALCGLAGCVLGGAASFLMPEIFVSEAVMRITPPVNPARWYAGTAPQPFLQHVERLKMAVWGALKDGSVRNVGIQLFPTTQTAGTIHISATADNRLKAQALARDVVRGFAQQYVIEERALQSPENRRMAEYKSGPNIEVLDPATLPQTPASPNRAVMAGLGLLAGLLAGAAISWRRRPRAPAMTATPQPI